MLRTEGREVAMTTYWQRRIDDNDVVVVDPADLPLTSTTPITISTDKK